MDLKMRNTTLIPMQR